MNNTNPEKNSPNESTETLTTVRQLAALARAIYELAKAETDKERLGCLKDLASDAATLFDEAELELHPDLGLDLVEFVMLNIDDAKEGRDANNASATTTEYGRVVGSMLDEIDRRISSSNSV